MATDVVREPAEFAAERFEVLDWDLESSAALVPGLSRIGPRTGCYALLRLGGTPTGRLLVSPGPSPTPAELERLALASCGPDLDLVLAERGMTRARLFRDAPPDPIERSSGGRHRPAELPAASVVVCTRDRPEGLRAALGSLLAQTHDNFEILVVDNAPATSATADVVAELADPRLRYVREDRPGLSVARNRALHEIDSPLVAWLDDDETADPDWLSELAAAFERHPEVAAVSGFVFPAELETTAQIYYESYGGHSKGRLVTPVVFDPADPASADPLFPVPPFGVGANMAFRTAALRRLGGFDEALGAGTRTQGGEDTLIFSQLLLSGEHCMYQPSAVTRHTHRRDMPGFAKQMYGYGTGLSAFYVALLAHDWRLVFRLPRLLLRGVNALRGSGDADSAVLGEIPPEFLRRKWRGFLAGPWLYVVARRSVAKRRRSQPTGGAGA
jgi:glycosyltransferase involved in cell wall biosynthesis